MLNPENRACLEWACRVVYGIDAPTEIYTRRDGTLVWDDLFKIDPANSPSDASIAALAQVMKLHLGGASFGELRDDLIRSGVGEQFANRIYDHLVDVLASEWAALRGRVRWYGDDMTCTASGETAVQGET
ncbi:hypothetical protein SAMN04487859_103234 [Roseovarius lutimaris]|uniref:Uncharacterized protein n=1 Tax=Roseovarius lutimaris TaxID=1005928 RepID=A0A1I4ZI00_9RHOB|nr:hypothetical protein [Roseovarius lutimaris]SFN49777.1 hypothetical protein SAMN04487859_103234 [Roseovarius lutimaris]